MKNKNPRESGITVVTMMMALVIAAILALIAFPNFSEYQRRAKRVEAKTALQEIANRQESFYLSNLSYTSNLANLGFPSSLSETGLYLISVSTATDQTFKAVAVPAPGTSQVDDSDCQQFTIDDQQTLTATPDPYGDCWQ